MEWQGDLPQDHAFVELLLPGLPSELDIQQLLRDTEDKLKLNACSIEQSLKELQGKMGESWTGERPPSPTECLQWFNPRNPSTVRPVATGNQELLDFLKALLQYLRTEECGRGAGLPMGGWASGVVLGKDFPNTTPSPTPQQPGPSAHTSVHTVRDDSALESHEVWDEVRLRLRRHLLDRLSRPLPVPQRIYCLQQLFFLYPEWEVLTHYQGLRSQAVLSLLHSALASSPGGKETGFDRLALGLRAAAPALCSALREELQVLNGVAKPHTILGFLNAAYLNTVSQELGAMMERECENALKDNTTPSGGKGRKSSARTKATFLTKVPKEWSYSLQTPKGRESAKSVVNLVLQALSFIYTNLPSAVASLPLPVRFLFHTAEKHLSQHARQLRSTGLLLWALLSCLCQCLEDPNSLELLCGLPLDRGAKERLALLSECLQGTMGQGQQKGVPKPTVHKVLQALEERKPKWCSMQLQKARKLCSESVFEWGESGVTQEGGGGVAEATEQKIGLILLEICHKPGGSEYLRQIYHIIQVNEPLLRSKLCVSSDPPIDSPRIVTFDLGTDRPGHPSPRFNPLHQFDHIGSNKFDQAAEGDWAWDWATLLPTYQGMSQVTLRALLANRWEMQDGAVLEDEEKPLVEELQKAYFNQSPGSQGPPGVTQAAQDEQHAAANIIN
ncbi:uncharacterized protein KIAA0825 homolog [Salvelinus alpinus]